jgi:Fe-S oxidoreductase
MLTIAEKIVFAVAVCVSMYVAWVNFSRMFKIIRRGQGELDFGQMSYRLGAGLAALAGQGDILRRRRVTSLFHMAVAWGFIYYVLVNAVDLLRAYFPGFHFLDNTPLGGPYRLLADVFSVAVLLGVVYFLGRRFIAAAPALTIRENVRLHPRALAGIRLDSLLVGLFILGHVGFRFVGESFLVAHTGDPWQPFASTVGGLWAGLSPAGQILGWHASWWLAMGLILAFVPYFPASKHAHLFMGPINFMTRPQRLSPGALDPINFDDESIEQFGATHLTDLPQTHLVDALACIMCHRCQDACPAYLTGKELSPSVLEINKRFHMKEHADSLAAGEADNWPLLDFAISESAVWACLSCGACIEVCPVGNAPMLDIMEVRREQVLMSSQFPAQLRGAFTGMERHGNPWQLSGDRLAWTTGLDFEVPTVAANPDFELLYWVGCAGAFDTNAQPTARAIATILHAAGINFAVLGHDESCTGDIARRAGNEYLFFEMATANIDALKAAGADKKRIVTGCPHCLHTLGSEYPALGGQFTVLHHTQLIAELIGRGQLKLTPGQLEATFHDPCYLGRHHGEYQAPRAALAAVGVSLREMERNRADSFCCGGGGAQLWKEEEPGQQAVSAARYAEAERTGATTLAVGCPFCARMLTDAGQSLPVKDVAVLVAEAIAN